MFIQKGEGKERERNKKKDEKLEKDREKRIERKVKNRNSQDRFLSLVPACSNCILRDFASSPSWYLTLRFLAKQQQLAPLI